MEVRHWTAMTPCSASERPRAARTRRARGEDDEGNDPAYLTRPALTPHPACQVACAREGSAALSPPRPDVWPAHATDGRLRAVYGRKRGGGPTVEARVHSDVFKATARRNRRARLVAGAAPKRPARALVQRCNDSIDSIS
jgi:hypothetical protein